MNWLRHLPARLSFMLRTRKWPSNAAMLKDAGRRFAEKFFRETPLMKALRGKKYAKRSPW